MAVPVLLPGKFDEMENCDECERRVIVSGLEDLLGNTTASALTRTNALTPVSTA